MVPRFKEQELDKIDAQLLRLHEMVDTIEWESEQLRVMEGLRAGNEALKSIHRVRKGIVGGGG